MLRFIRVVFFCLCGVCLRNVLRATASPSAKKLSSSDWCGFDLIWKKREGTLAIREALESYIAFEEVTTLQIRKSR